MPGRQKTGLDFTPLKGAMGFQKVTYGVRSCLPGAERFLSGNNSARPVHSKLVRKHF